MNVMKLDHVKIFISGNSFGERSEDAVFVLKLPQLYDQYQEMLIYFTVIYFIDRGGLSSALYSLISLSSVSLASTFTIESLAENHKN